MDLFTLSAKIELDMKNLESQIAKARNKLEDVEDAQIGVTVDASDVNGQLDSIKTAVKDASGTVEIDATADTQTAQADVQGLSDTADSVSDVSIDAEADTEQAQTDVDNLDSKASDLDGTILSIEATANTEEAQGNVTSLSDVIGTAKGGSTELSSSLTNVYSSMKDLYGTLAGGALVKAFLDIASSIWEAADAAAVVGDGIDKQSQRLGLSYHDYQYWDAMFNLNGTNMSEQNRAFRTLNQQISGYRSGDEKAVAMFDAMGISIDDSTTAGGIMGQVLKAIGTNKQVYDLYGADLIGAASLMSLAPLFNSMNSFDENGVSAFDAYNQILTDGTFVYRSDEAIRQSAEHEDWKYLGDTSSENAKANSSAVNVVMGLQTGASQTKNDMNKGFWGFLDDWYNAYRESIVEKNKIQAEMDQALYGGWTTEQTVDIEPEVDTGEVQDQLDEQHYSIGVEANVYGLPAMPDDATSHYGGLDYVPYDGYKAVLHEGETILNASSADAIRGGSGLAQAVAGAIREAMTGVSVNMDGAMVGNMVTGRVDKNIGRKSRAGRYR